VQEQGVSLVDFQVYTEHFEILGAEMIDGNLFIKMLETKGAK
jgi:Leu/Phe-tRNA-protein transferase